MAFKTMVPKMIGTENSKINMISPRTFIFCHEPLVCKMCQIYELNNYIADSGLDLSMIVISNTFDLIMQKIIITPVILL